MALPAKYNHTKLNWEYLNYSRAWMTEIKLTGGGNLFAIMQAETGVTDIEVFNGSRLELQIKANNARTALNVAFLALQSLGLEPINTIEPYQPQQ